MFFFVPEVLFIIFVQHFGVLCSVLAEVEMCLLPCITDLEGTSFVVLHNPQTFRSAVSCGDYFLFRSSFLSIY